jgi:hypothetical protein
VASRITELVLDSRDPAGLAAWWAAVVGYEVVGTDGTENAGVSGATSATDVQR